MLIFNSTSPQTWLEDNIQVAGDLLVQVHLTSRRLASVLLHLVSYKVLTRTRLLKLTMSSLSPFSATSSREKLARSDVSPTSHAIKLNCRTASQSVW